MFRSTKRMPTWHKFNTSCFLNPSTLVLWVLLPSIVIIHYQVYLQYWFVQLIGGRVIRLGFLILPLFYVAMIYHLMNVKYCRARNGIIRATNVTLALYVILSGVSIVANENNLSNARIYFFSATYPVLLYFTIQAVYRRIEHITLTMRIIFVVGILVSIHSIYSLLNYDVTSIKTVDTIIGGIESVSPGKFVGAGGISVQRLGMPGLGPDTYGSLLILVIMIGLCFYKTSHGLVKGMYLGGMVFSVVFLTLSFSRGAMVSLVVALLYLAWKRFFTLGDFVAAVTVFVVLMGASGFGKIVREAEHVIVRVKDIGMRDSSGDHRLEAAKHSVELWKNCPLIGCGVTRVRDEERFLVAGDHAYYTRMLVERGLVTIIPFMCFAWLLFRGVSTCGMDMDETARPMMHTLKAGMVGMMVNLLAFGPAEAFHMWIWFGLVAAWINIASGMKVGGRGRHLARVLGDPRASS